MSISYFIALTLGFICRFFLLEPEITSFVSSRVELVTPYTSWEAVVEGLTLAENGYSPYDGDIYHETPLMLALFQFLRSVSSKLIPIFFLLLDLTNSYLLFIISKRCIKLMSLAQSQRKKSLAKDADSLLLTPENTYFIPSQVSAVYLLNPVTILTCVGQSTTVVHNFLLILTFYYTLKGRKLAASLAVALSTYELLYPAMLIVPCSMFLAQKNRKDFNYLSRTALVDMLTTVGYFLGFLSFFLTLSYFSYMSWDFLYSVHGFILSVPSMTPNMGLFWYFFTEMFEHFRTFFLFVFQINAFIYTVPLAIRLMDHPIFLMYLQVALISIFKSYPVLGDSAFYLCLLPLWKHLYQYMNNILVTCVLLVISCILAPVVWHLWIFAGSANANFFFAMTLIYNLGQVFLVSDLLISFLKREFHLINGIKLVDEEGKPTYTVLK